MLSVVGLQLFSPRMSGIQPVPTKEDPSISIYCDESSLPLFHHLRTMALFLGASGFGVERAGVNLITHATLDPYVMSWSDDEGAYDAQVIDLVGILQAPKPRVYATMQDLYVNDKMPGEDRIPTAPEQRAAEVQELGIPTLPLLTLKQEKEWKVRDLDSFEMKALGLLQAGSALVWQDRGSTFRAVGAIRMQATCARCHEDKKDGELLGAFTYFGFKRPQPGDIDRTLEHKLAELARQEPFSKEFIDARNSRLEPGDINSKEEWPVPETAVFYIDRDLAHSGIVTPGMHQRLKALLGRLPRNKDHDGEDAVSK
jgi:cytochrome c553